MLRLDEEADLRFWTGGFFYSKPGFVLKVWWPLVVVSWCFFPFFFSFFRQDEVLVRGLECLFRYMFERGVKPI